MTKQAAGFGGNIDRKCYGPNCPHPQRPLRNYHGQSRYWESAENFGYKGNNYFCTLQCGMDWAVLKCDAGSD